MTTMTTMTTMTSRPLTERRVLVRVGRMTVARDWSLVQPGEEYRETEDGPLLTRDEDDGD